MGYNREVTINGRKTSLPASRSNDFKVIISAEGCSTLLTLANGVKVTFDNGYRVTVTVPGTFRLVYLSSQPCNIISYIFIK